MAGWDVPDEGFRFMQLRYPNRIKIELMEPLGDNGFLPKFLSFIMGKLSVLLMSPIKIIDLLYGWCATSVNWMKNGKANGAADAVLYGADGSRDSAAMAELLSQMGVEFEYRSVNSDPAARREWEDLDGEHIPMLRLGSKGIVRGLDQIKVQQLIGWVGC